MSCVSCSSGFHWECVATDNDGNCCCLNDQTPDEVIEEEDERSTNTRRTYKRDGVLKDQQSTGRKRAAQMYPLHEGEPCEWQNLRLCGGGKFPIIGCASGTQQARHHGPDKNTLNNEQGNVHRICHKCHNRWHTKNDPDYVPGDPGQAHNDKEKATIHEVMQHELYWATTKTVRVKD